MDSMTISGAIQRAAAGRQKDRRLRRGMPRCRTPRLTARECRTETTMPRPSSKLCTISTFTPGRSTLEAVVRQPPVEKQDTAAVGLRAVGALIPTSVRTSRLCRKQGFFLRRQGIVTVPPCMKRRRGPALAPPIGKATSTTVRVCLLALTILPGTAGTWKTTDF
jgi:hypothetical protein